MRTSTFYININFVDNQIHTVTMSITTKWTEPFSVDEASNWYFEYFIIEDIYVINITVYDSDDDSVQP